MWNRNLVKLLAASVLVLGVSACNNDDNKPPHDDGLPPNLPTFSIGGTVTGLSGTLSLQNSNGNTVAVTANGAFTFATEMFNGNTYNVTVGAPPNSQTCTVANGTGTVTLNDITNIAVTCAANPNLIHVAVTGLGAGKTLVLRAQADATSGDLAVTSNGSFAFPTGFVGGAEYEVIVLTQPQGQACTIPNPHGDIDPAIITNLAVICINSSASAREWSPAEPVATDADIADPNSMNDPQIRYDAAGNALAVWEADRVGEQGKDIVSRRYVPGAGWGSPVIVPRQDVSGQLPEVAGLDTRTDPKLAVAANGDAVVVFHYGGPRNLAASFYTKATNSWSELDWIFASHPDDPDGADDPSVSIDADGNVLVVFENFGLIHYTRFTPGSGWLADVNFGKLAQPIDPNSNSREPKLATDANGDAVVVWKIHDVFPDVGAFDTHLVSSRYDRDADVWSNPVPVDQDDLFDQQDGVFFGHDVMVDAAGNAAAVWTQYDGARLHVMFNQLTGNTWGTPVIVETGNDGVNGNAYDTHAVMDANGIVMAMWLQNDVDDGHFVANRYVPGAGWGTQQVIGQYSSIGFGAESTEMKLVGNAAGDVIALWTLYSGIGDENVLEPYQVLANEFNGTTLAWGAPDVIDKEETDVEWGEASEIALDIDAEGNATAVWKDLGSPESGIRAAHFE
ncbi:MAG: hypothetical protein ABI821_04085 [Pseudomonadota bacterium]